MKTLWKLEYFKTFSCKKCIFTLESCICGLGHIKISKSLLFSFLFLSLEVVEDIFKSLKLSVHLGHEHAQGKLSHSRALNGLHEFKSLDLSRVVSIDISEGSLDFVISALQSKRLPSLNEFWLKISEKCQDECF